MSEIFQLDVEFRLQADKRHCYFYVPSAEQFSKALSIDFIWFAV